MKDAIAHADRYFNGEQWVLGDQAAANIDRAALAQGLRDRYFADFVKQWRTYIKSASVVRYAGLKDATTKLAQLSGNQSPLLELFALASQQHRRGRSRHCQDIPACAVRGSARQHGSLHRCRPTRTT